MVTYAIPSPYTMRLSMSNCNHWVTPECSVGKRYNNKRKAEIWHRPANKTYSFFTAEEQLADCNQERQQRARSVPEKHHHQQHHDHDDNDDDPIE